MTIVRASLEKLVYLFTFSLLVFSPFPLGSVEPWARFVFQLQAFLLLFIWLLLSFYRDDSLNLGVKGFLPLLVFVFICLLQIVPLPGFVLGTLSESSLEIWKENQSLLSRVGFPSEGNAFTISLYPNATWKETLLFLSYVAFGFVVSRAFTTRREIKLLLFIVLAVSFFEAAYGMYQYLLGVKSSAYPNMVFARGTFVNRNHYAGFLEMAVPLALGYVMSLGTRHTGRRKSFFKTLVSSDDLLKQILFLFFTGLMLLALFFSKSRMGIFSALLSLVFFYLTYSSFRRGGGEKTWIIILVIAVAVLYGLWIGLYSVFERFLLIEAESPGRLKVWKDMFNMIGDFPLFGTGFGTFSYVYPLYKESMERALVFTYAHNDYLQLMSETGILGFLSLISALVIFVLFSLRALNRFSQERNYFRFSVTLGALTGIVSILIHSLADFNLHIPSNALYFAFLIGFIKAVGRSRE
ncbi:MAG TPA: O-antigen ligase family protein [Thermodesulfobacteriota bacterium]|nr:O-antigen ligase family protein [Thermodesulfobacteriota bacterium]